MPSYENEIMRVARAVARLQKRRTFLRRELKKTERELKAEKKNLRALANRGDERRPDIFPSRVFGDGVGHAAHTLPDDRTEDQVLAGVPHPADRKTGTE